MAYLSQLYYLTRFPYPIAPFAPTQTLIKRSWVYVVYWHCYFINKRMLWWIESSDMISPSVHIHSLETTCFHRGFTIVLCYIPLTISFVLIESQRLHKDFDTLFVNRLIWEVQLKWISFFTSFCICSMIQTKTKETFFFYFRHDERVYGIGFMSDAPSRILVNGKNCIRKLFRTVSRSAWWLVWLIGVYSDIENRAPRPSAIEKQLLSY